MLKPSSKFILFTTIFCGLTSQTLAKLPIIPGLWEITRETKIDGTGMPQMSDMMKNLPPEAQAQLKKMMEQQGIGKTSKGIKVCITKEEIELEKIPQEKGCDMKVKSRSEKEFVYNFNCKDPKAEGHAVVTAENSKSYTTKLDMKVDEDGKEREMKMVSHGKWLQSDCGEYKKK